MAATRRSSLESGRPALALVEPASPGDSAGQPLAFAISPVYYRTKATYFFWMLRDVAGDAALSAALRAYDPPPTRSGLPSRPWPRRIREAPRTGQRTPRSYLALRRLGRCRQGSARPDHRFSLSRGRTDGSGWSRSTSPTPDTPSCEVPVTVHSDTNAVTQRVVVPGHGKAVQRILISASPFKWK